MDRHHWIVSDPPHRGVDYDGASVLLGLAVSEARMKINFRAPEAWLAYSDADEAAQSAAALRDAGLNLFVLDANDLLRVPPPTPASWFSFVDEDSEFVAYTDGGEVHIGYDDPVVGAFWRPPPDFAADDSLARSKRDSWDPMRQRSTGGITDRLTGISGHKSVSDALERRTNLDLYYLGDGEVRRVSIAQDFVSFSGLGDKICPRAADNMDLTVAECERHFTRLVLDSRMVNVRPRQRAVVGAPKPGEELRKLLSFGTVGLQKLLESVSPDLDGMTQYELGSRCSYLMLRGDELPLPGEG